jgi:hypothetical protein
MHGARLDLRVIEVAKSVRRIRYFGACLIEWVDVIVIR